MAPKARFATSSSGHGPEQETTQGRTRASLFSHTNHTFISKPSDVSPSPAGSIFGTSTSSFTFTAGAPEGTPVKRPSATPKLPSLSIPTFSFTSPQYPSDTGGSGSSDSGSRSQSVNSLAGGMADLAVSKVKPKSATSDKAASLSAASLSGGSKAASPSVEDEDSTSEEPSEKSSEDESSATSDLSANEEAAFDAHLALLRRRPELDELNEIKTTPIFTEAVRKYALTLASGNVEQPFSQYGLLAGDLTGTTDGGGSDPRIFWNIAAPSSYFICGSQGSGKSHTLSCLLENALAPCKANVLPRPLTGIVFHYDTFISDSGGSPCEVAWLSSNKDIKVRVLCPPTNIRTMQVSPPLLPSLTTHMLTEIPASLQQVPQHQG